MKKLLIYFSVCISIFSADIEEEKNIEEQRTKDLIYEKVKLDYEYSQRKNKADYLIFKYIKDYELACYEEAKTYDTRVLEFLISKGANINSTNPDFFYELLDKVYDPKIYEYLIGKGLKVDRNIIDGYSLLVPFIINHYPEEYIISLINKGAKVTADNSLVGKEMIFSIWQGYSEGFVDKLYDMTINKEDIAVNLAKGIYDASSEEEILVVKNVLKYLLKKGMSFNKSELFDALIEAEVHDIEVFEILFKGGLDPNLKYKHNNNPILAQAIYFENYEVVELMLKKGATPSGVIFGDTTILGYAKDEKMHNLLVKYGAKNE